MAPCKRVAVPAPAPFNQPGSAALPPSTSLLDLNDDLWGVLYSSLEEGKDRMALRHACSALYK